MRAKQSLLQVEALEAREVPATAVLSAGVLSITGTDGADQITVREGAGQLVVAGLAQSFSASEVRRVEVRGLGGDDMIDVSRVNVPGSIDGEGTRRS